MMKLQSEMIDDKKSKNFEPLLDESRTPSKASTFYKKSSKMINYRANEKIIAFVRGWKIRKIMK